MVVRVSIDLIEQHEDICDKGLDSAAQAMCLTAVIVMASVAAACLLPQGCVAAYSKFVRARERKRLAAQANKDR
jgi:hypothetical protein